MATLNHTFVNKIPPDFVERTIARLLPPEEDILAMSDDETRQLAKYVSKLRKTIPLEPIKYYMPNPGGQADFMTLNDESVRVLLFVAGNKTGKTTAGAVKMAEALCGEILWGHAWRPPATFKTPAYGCVFAEDFDSHKEVTFPAYMSWCPSRYIKDVKKNSAGQVVHVEHTNGSFLFFRTYDQGSDKAEGKDWHVVWCDEPPPRTIYTAVLRGLVTLNGTFLITATLLKEGWIFDEAEKHQFIRMFLSTIYDNPWLSDQARTDFVNSLDDDERAVRVEGKPSTLVGLIYKEFQDASPFVIPEQEFNPLWPVVMGVDPHERKPNYVMWATITPSNTIIFFDFMQIPSELELLRDTLKDKEDQHCRFSVLTIMDPNRGASPQLDGRSWKDVYEEWGYGVELGEDNLTIGHSTVRTALKLHQVRFTENLRGMGGPIHAMLRYSWDDWARVKRTQPKSLKERPAELYKHYPDIVRYMVMANLNFDALKYGPKIIDRYTPPSRRLGIRAGL